MKKIDNQQIQFSIIHGKQFILKEFVIIIHFFNHKSIEINLSSQQLMVPEDQINEMENLDPFLSLQSNPNLLYKNTHTCSIYISEKPGYPQKLPNDQQLIVKVVAFGSLDNPRNVSLELTSDNQLDFNFQFNCNDIEFRRIREIQNYVIQFREYPEVIIQNFQKLLTSTNQYTYEASFTIFSKNQGKLELIRKSEFKNDSIMQFDFHRSSEQHIRNSVQYRYDLMRREYADNYSKYREYRETIKSKNPSLMLQIDKALKKK